MRGCFSLYKYPPLSPNLLPFSSSLYQLDLQEKSQRKRSSLSLHINCYLQPLATLFYFLPRLVTKTWSHKSRCILQCFITCFGLINQSFHVSKPTSSFSVLITQKPKKIQLSNISVSLSHFNLQIEAPVIYFCFVD